MVKKITIYGTWWCGDCSRARRFFDRNHILYNWVDIDSNERGEELVFTMNHGMRSVPTIIFEDGSILVEPTEKELQFMLETVLKSS